MSCHCLSMDRVKGVSFHWQSTRGISDVISQALTTRWHLALVVFFAISRLESPANHTGVIKTVLGYSFISFGFWPGSYYNSSLKKLFGAAWIRTRCDLSTQLIVIPACINLDRVFTSFTFCVMWENYWTHSHHRYQVQCHWNPLLLHYGAWLY